MTHSLSHKYDFNSKIYLYVSTEKQFLPSGACMHIAYRCSVLASRAALPDVKTPDTRSKMVTSGSRKTKLDLHKDKLQTSERLSRTSE